MKGTKLQTDGQDSVKWPHQSTTNDSCFLQGYSQEITQIHISERCTVDFKTIIKQKKFSILWDTGASNPFSAEFA